MPLMLASDVQLRRAVDRRQTTRLFSLLCVLGDLAVLPVPFFFAHRLPPRPHVLPQPFLAAFAPEPALAVAAEAGRGVELVGAVDPHRAGLDLGGDLQGEVDVLGPDARGETEAGVVGELQGFFRGAEGHRHQHRAEDLHLRDGRRRGDVGEQGRRIEPAFARTAPRRLPERGAFLDPLADQTLDAFELHRSDDRADVDRLVARIADAQRLHAGAELGVEGLGDALVDQQARAGAADLPLVEPDGVHHPFDRAVQVRVVEDEKRRLAAQLQRQALARPRRRLADQPADLGRAGEGDLVDAGMPDQQLAGAAVALDDVDHPGRQAGVAADPGEGGRGERGEFRRLQDHRVAHRQGRRDLPGQHEEREVPRDDLPGDAHRHVPGELALHELRPAGVVVEVAGDQRHVEVARLADRLAVVHRLQDGEQARVLLHVAGERVEVPRAAVAAERPPSRLRGARRRHRGVHLCGAALGHAGERLAVGGAQGVEEFVHRRAAEGAVDERQDLPAAGRQPGQGGVCALRSRAVIHGLEDLRDC